VQPLDVKRAVEAVRGDKILKLLEKFAQRHKYVVGDDAALQLVYAVKVRMVQLVQQSVILARHRCGASIPGPPVFVDVPLAKFATLAAENIMLTSRMVATERRRENLPPALERLRNDAIAGLAAGGGGNVPEELLAKLNDADEQQQSVDMEIARQMLGERAESRQNRAVTAKDVIAALGNDALLARDGNFYRHRGFHAFTSLAPANAPPR
jgi:hypothetical protein